MKGIRITALTIGEGPGKHNAGKRTARFLFEILLDFGEKYLDTRKTICYITYRTSEAILLHIRRKRRSYYEHQ
ncbi:MAG: hypothetical protein LBS02_08680 [Hungatella sp.]|jgi:hypothetical protein|nr:hypothetical protein [Hungatella sp.]